MHVLIVSKGAQHPHYRKQADGTCLQTSLHLPAFMMCGTSVPLIHCQKPFSLSASWKHRVSFMHTQEYTCVIRNLIFLWRFIAMSLFILCLSRHFLHFQLCFHKAIIYTLLFNQFFMRTNLSNFMSINNNQPVSIL